MSTTDTMRTGTAPRRGRPGARADRPTDIPAGGWKQVLVRTKDELKADRVALMAGGVTFYAMLAIVPALIAAVTVWGLVSDPTQIERQVETFASQLPGGAATLISDQVSRIAGSSSTALGWTLVISLLAALWSASSGTKGLMNAVNAAYDEPETRGFLKERGIAIALTVGFIFFGLILIGLIAVVPAVLGAVGLGVATEYAITWGRWPLLALALLAGVTVVYRVAPDRDRAQWRWLAPGAVAAVVLWLVASVGFAWYVGSVAKGSYNETYGAMGGVIVLMLWLFLSAFAILVGAELNAEAERQTRCDTTVGTPQPMGERGANAADVGPQEHRGA